MKFVDIFDNRVVLAALVAWLVAQILKFVIEFIVNKNVDFSRFVGSGGMPSSHSAFVVGLTTIVGRTSGFDSVAFGICFVFSFIIMYDATGVRWAAGEQAKVLNKIKEKFEHHDPIEGKDLKELIGHTPFEVLAGAILGILIALMF